MEDDIEKPLPDVGQESPKKMSLLAGITRPMSSTRPPSRPAPSARVRALGKDDLDDVDQNSEDDQDDDIEDDDDDDQGIQVEGARLFFARRNSFSKPRQNQRTYPKIPEIPLLRREKLPPRRIGGATIETVSVSSSSLSFTSSSITDEKLDEELQLKIQDIRDMQYLELPYSCKRAYDPADFEHLQVSSEMKELFQYITRYTPQNIDLDTGLKPFIPEFIPAVGDIDAFIKVPRPDGVPDKLGLIALDEPCAKQSDQTVLDLQLRAISKETTLKSVVCAVKSLENADKRPKEIEAWIESIANLHRSKPPPTVNYSRNMPDIDTLMQEWPSEFEDTLNNVGIPSADLDCSLEEYVQLLCGLMDIPVYKSKIQSLHVLFTLFLEFKNSQHFRSLAMNNEFGDSAADQSVDQLVIRD